MTENKSQSLPKQDKTPSEKPLPPWERPGMTDEEKEEAKISYLMLMDIERKVLMERAAKRRAAEKAAAEAAKKSST